MRLFEEVARYRLAVVQQIVKPSEVVILFVGSFMKPNTASQQRRFFLGLVDAAGRINIGNGRVSHI